MTSIVVRGCEVDGEITDVAIDAGVIEAVQPGLDGDEVIDGRGGVLLPGLHDHHLHLLAMAAADASVRCGPPEVKTPDDLRIALRASPDAWVRGVGYHDSVAGPIDRHWLDEAVADRPVRVQHRSGGVWIVNSLASQMLDLARSNEAGVERDEVGSPTGRLWRMDTWLRDRVPPAPVDLSDVGWRLAAFGVTGVTDATPDLDHAAVLLIAGAGLAQRVHLLGADAAPGPLTIGPRKLLLHDHNLPSFVELRDEVAASHAAGRAVAVHVVTREALVLTLAVIEDVGAAPGDRLEHAAIVPHELLGTIKRLGLAVVNQPAFLLDRGDDYLDEVHMDDIPHLCRMGSLLDAGIAVAASSDAPFGDPDPWRAMAAARDRRTSRGHPIGLPEAIPADAALAGLLSPHDDPGGPPRRIMPGAPADVCLLHTSLAAAVAEPDRKLVRMTLCAGEVVFRS